MAFGLAVASMLTFGVGVLPDAAQADGTFNVSIDLDGIGHVTSNPAGIDCSTQTHIDCDFPFDDGASVTLTAKPDAGMSFVNWTGDQCDTLTTLTCTVSVTADLNIGAVFAAKNTFVPLESPIRLLDTRAGQLGLLEQNSSDLDLVLQPGVVYSRSWTEGGAPGTINVLNVTAVAPAAPGFVRIFGCNDGDPTPATSLLNYAAGTTVQNIGTVKISGESKVCYQSSQATRLVIDMTGFFADGMSTFQAPSAPVRLVDTRVDQRGVLEFETDEATAYGPGTVRRYVPGGLADLPASGVYALVLNIVAIRPLDFGTVIAYPCNKVTDGAPKVTTLSFAPTTTAAGGAVVTLHKDSQGFCVKSSGTADILIDMTGWHMRTGGGFKSFGGDGKPKSLYDTRAGIKGELEGGTDVTAAMEAGVARRLKLASKAGFPSISSLGSVSLTITAFDATKNGYVTVWACESVDETPPTTSNLNVRAGTASTNASLVGVADDGGICVVTNQTLNIDIDATGWYLR